MGFITISVSILIAFFVFVNSFSANRCLHSVDSIYQFGDSYIDTGNLVRDPVIGSLVPAARLPYGETFFGKPTGRYSDGLVFLDYLTKALKLPFLEPYRDKNASFVNGVNFAVAGATALNVSFFTDRGLSGFAIGNVPLTNQTEWFKQYLDSISSSKKERSKKLRNSLVVLGEIGANDLVYGFTEGKSLQEIRTYLPHIVQVILDNAREMIGLGATSIVVPGNFPFGCFPLTLVLFSETNTTFEEFDKYGCSKSYNNLSKALNTQLENGLAQLQMEFPKVTIVYVDFYKPFYTFLARTPDLGFNIGSSLLKACCGRGSRYNYDGNFGGPNTCGAPGVPFCPNPNNYIFWDGIHFTQEANYQISKIIIPAILSKITCS